MHLEQELFFHHVPLETKSSLLKLESPKVLLYSEVEGEMMAGLKSSVVALLEEPWSLSTGLWGLPVGCPLMFPFKASVDC